MTFAFGREGQREVIRHLSSLRQFQRGGISGRVAPGRVPLLELPREYAHGLDEAVYVVFCYDTPIAWVTMEDDADETGRINYLPDWQYSATTSYYQKLVLLAWDRVVDPRPEYSREQNKGTERGRSSDIRYGRSPARQRPETRSDRTAEPAHYRHPAHP